MANPRRVLIRSTAHYALYRLADEHAGACRPALGVVERLERVSSPVIRWRAPSIRPLPRLVGLTATGTD